MSFSTIFIRNLIDTDNNHLIRVTYENPLMQVVEIASFTRNVMDETSFKRAILRVIIAVMENIYLIGLPGSGKTTVGRSLARFLYLDFIDTDQMIEERTGVSISHIFEIEGEAGFRKRETRLFEEVSNRTRTVISTGGGVILSDSNRQLMGQHGQVVYLKASMDILWSRLKNCQNRPLLQTAAPQARIAGLMKEREPLYDAQADLIIEVTSETANRTARKIAQLINNPSAGRQP